MRLYHDPFVDDFVAKHPDGADESTIAEALGVTAHAVNAQLRTAMRRFMEQARKMRLCQ